MHVRDCPRGKVAGRLADALTKRIRARFALDEPEKEEEKPDEEIPTSNFGLTRCPGESDCAEFRMADAEAKRFKIGSGLDACNECAIKHTKNAIVEVQKSKQDGEEFDAIISKAYRTRAERRSTGKSVNSDEMPCLAYEALLIIDAITEHCEQEAGTKQRLATEALLEVLPQVVAAGMGVELKR